MQMANEMFNFLSHLGKANEIYCDIWQSSEGIRSVKSVAGHAGENVERERENPPIANGIANFGNQYGSHYGNQYGGSSGR